MKKLLGAFLILILLFIILTYASVLGTTQEFETCTVIENQTDGFGAIKNHDSLLIVPSNLYHGNAIKTLMQGENYREAWATPIKVPVVLLDTLMGGMTIIKKGGGKQTHSLKLKNKEGILFTLRSVTKDPQALIPNIARTLHLENIIVDGISGQHPYAALLASELANKAHLVNTHPKMIFVPKQTVLGKYNSKYGNRLFLLEYETEGDKNWTSYKNAKKIIETKDLQELKAKLGEDIQIDEAALVKARLFDLLIGDWDRHAEQWGWILEKHRKKTVAIPLAGDRDNAFFDLDGVIPQILTNKHLNPLVRPYDKDIDHMPGLVYPFDIYFLKNTSEEVYITEAKKLQQLLSNDVIDEAFKIWPKEIYDLNGIEIKEKFIARRNDLMKYAKEFHNVIKERELLEKPLKGSEKADLTSGMIKCFECK